MNRVNCKQFKLYISFRYACRITPSIQAPGIYLNNPLSPYYLIPELANCQIDEVYLRTYFQL